jgi:integrase
VTRRRAAGEGTVVHRADGRWEARLTQPGAGRRGRLSIYGKTRQEVVAKLAERRSELSAGLHPTSDRYTVGDLLTDWLVSVRPPNTRPSTYLRYEGIVRLHLLPQLRSTKLRQLTPSDVERVLLTVQARRSHRTASHVRAVLRTALSRAVRHRLVPVNAASLATWKQPPQTPVRCLSAEEVRGFLTSIEADTIGPLVTMAILTSARQGELLGLRWADVDLETNRLSIHNQLQFGQLVPTKTERSRRTMPIASRMAEALRRQRARQAEQRLLAGSRWVDRGFVFTTRDGAPWDSTNVTKRFQRLLLAVGLPRMRFHDLRHTAASLLLAEGVQPRVVMEILGHSQISVTLNTYSHVIPALQHDAFDLVERRLGG